MTSWLRSHIADHVAVAEAMVGLEPRLSTVGAVIRDALASGGTLWTFGNGGSAADAQHFTGEIVGHYKRDRRPLPAVTLSADPSTITCISNDYGYPDAFARQVQALVRRGDIVAAFTTSGQSPNVVNALAAARRNGATTVLFGGAGGGPACDHADYALLAPSVVTPRIQEMHTLMLHVISEMIDSWAAGTEPMP
jgi:D-sedoheptulose 7-phosphate isomerase